MQRRAAAIYATFFLVLAAGAYGMIGLAQEPTVTVDDPAHSLSSGDSLTADERTYTVEDIQAGTNEDDDLRSVDLSWVNESAEYTETVENDTTVSSETISWAGQTVQNGTYRVIVASGEDPTEFTLVQEFDVSGLLADDPAVEDQTVNRSDGQRYVVYRENGTTRPLSEYLPEPEQEQFSEGGTIQYESNETQVGDVTSESVTLVWTGPRTNTMPLTEGDTTTLDGTEYVAHFPDNGTLELSTDVRAYERQVNAVDKYHERINGFWGISIIAGMAAVFMLAAAYLPSRY